MCSAFPKTGPRPRFFASGKVLQKHADRTAIVTANPNISKREALAIMRDWRAQQNGSGQPEVQTDDNDFEDDEQGEGDDTEPNGNNKPADDEKDEGDIRRLRWPMEHTHGTERCLPWSCPRVIRSYSHCI